MKSTAIEPTRKQDFPRWYQQVIINANLAEMSPVRGCMVIKAWGYSLWENIKFILDTEIKESGHDNVYFPSLIPLEYIQAEGEHIKGFAKECAVVTHTKLQYTDGKLLPAKELDKPLIIRPTSEAIFGVMLAKWIQSYRDLPIKLNQWSNVVRWELRTRMFLRTTEFLWQEGHTAHSTMQEALEETTKMVYIYQDLIENYLAIPVIIGTKPCFEKFPGATTTYTLEAIMQDHKALQIATSHFMGQNFAKAYNIKFTNKDDNNSYAWTTSWGISTRLIGGLIMSHSDDHGLVIPPKIAPKHVVIIPICQDDSIDKTIIMNFCENLYNRLSNFDYHGKKLQVMYDTRDMRKGEKVWHWIKHGVPIQLQIGLKEITSNCVSLYRRDIANKQASLVNCDDLLANITYLLDEMQQNLYETAKIKLTEQIVFSKDLEEFNKLFSSENINNVVRCYALDDVGIEKYIKPLKVSARCILNDDAKNQRCIFTGINSDNVKLILFAKSY